MMIWTLILGAANHAVIALEMSFDFVTVHCFIVEYHGQMSKLLLVVYYYKSACYYKSCFDGNSWWLMFVFPFGVFKTIKELKHARDYPTFYLKAQRESVNILILFIR